MCECGSAGEGVRDGMGVLWGGEVCVRERVCLEWGKAEQFLSWWDVYGFMFFYTPKQV